MDDKEAIKLGELTSIRIADGKTGKQDGKTGTQDGDNGTQDGDNGTQDGDTGTQDGDTGTQDGDTRTQDGDTGTQDGVPSDEPQSSRSDLSKEVASAISERNHTALLALVSEDRAALEARDTGGWSPLSQAVMSQWSQGVELLLKAGADVTARTGDMTLPTVLHQAASLEDYEIVEMILAHRDAKQLVNVDSYYKETPLMVLISNRKPHPVKSLLEAGANYCCKSKGKTVLYLAVKYDKLEVVETLFSHNPKAAESLRELPMSYDKFLMTPLHVAAHEGNERVARELLERGCDPCAHMEFYGHLGFTALHLAVYSNRLGVARVLLKKESSLGDEPCSGGWTPLHIACKMNHPECCRLLLLSGADLSATITRTDGRLATATAILVFSLPFSVDFLHKIFDSCIKYDDVKDEAGGKKRSIKANFKILSPTRTKHFQQMRVIDSLLQTGNQLNQQQLLLHPLVETYLYVQWKALSSFYYLLVILYLIFSFAFSCQLIGVYHLRQMASYPQWLVILNCFLSTIAFWGVFYYECILMVVTFYNFIDHCRAGSKCKIIKSTVTFGFSVLKWIWFIVMLIFLYLSVDVVVNLREFAILSLLFCWFRIMFLISRIPYYGFYMLMFFEVTVNFFKVFLSLCGIIVLFVTVFLLEFGSAGSAFNSTSSAISKTFVMMSSEFEYSNLRPLLEAETQISFVMKEFIFLLFVVLVAIVMMNILVAKAIQDVGDIDRVRKLAEFLTKFERVIEFTRLIWSKLHCKCEIGRAINKTISISVDENLKGGAKLPQELHLKLLEIAHENSTEKSLHKSEFIRRTI